MAHKMQPEDIPAMESALQGKGVAMADFLAKCQINEATWWRWKTKNLLPRMSNWRRVAETFESMISGEG